MIPGCIFIYNLSLLSLKTFEFKTSSINIVQVYNLLFLLLHEMSKSDWLFLDE